MNESPRTVRIGDLVGSTVVTATGARVGRVADVAVTRRAPHAVTALVLGTGGWLARLGIARVPGTGGSHGRELRRVCWLDVAAFDGRTVTLKAGVAPGPEATPADRRREHGGSGGPG